MNLKHLIVIFIIFYSAQLVAQQEDSLKVFNNGDTADADDINANFSILEQRIHAIEQNSGCSARQEASSVIISCADGTSGVLASEGTVIVLEGEIGTTPVNTLPSGKFVALDANETIVAELDVAGLLPSASLDGPIFRVLLSPLNLESLLVNIDTDESVLLTGVSNQHVFYPTDDCSGVPYSKSHTRGWLQDLGSDGFFTLTPDTPIILFQARSRRNTGTYYSSMYSPPGSCDSANIAVNAGPLTPFEPALELIEAAYPVSIEQLP